MSRRDTIIVAVLINVGLLIVLFATALSSRSEPILAKNETAPIPAEVEAAHSLQPMAVKPSPVHDEVDQVLTQYSHASAANPVAATGEPVQTSSLTSMESHPMAEQAAPVASETSMEKKEPAFIEVTVKKGDVLEKIARVNHSTVEEVMKANQMSHTRLKVGQVLRIPQKKTVKKETAPMHEIAADSASAKYYIVKSGDNPWTIAAKNHIKVEDLLRLNNLTQKDARHLKPGDKLRIE